jgi:hypothetical protein
VSIKCFVWFRKRFNKLQFVALDHTDTELNTKAGAVLNQQTEVC